MPKKKTPKDYAPHVDEGNAPRCCIEGCKAQGAYKAPASRKDLHHYRWLCLDHIREYNAKWDFFDGMSRAEIEAFMKDAVTGHRPTWDRNMPLHQQYDKLQQAVHDFLNPGSPKLRNAPPVEIPVKVRQALSVMNMEYPYSAQELKITYRKLVKKYHPDTNKDDKHTENTFKKITVANKCLIDFIEKQS